jgi:hypothetical protein
MKSFRGDKGSGKLPLATAYEEFEETYGFLALR